MLHNNNILDRSLLQGPKTFLLQKSSNDNIKHIHHAHKRHITHATQIPTHATQIPTHATQIPTHATHIPTHATQIPTHTPPRNKRKRESDDKNNTRKFIKTTHIHNNKIPPQSGFVPEENKQFDIDFDVTINTLCNDTNNFQPSEEHNKHLSQLCIKHTYDFPTMTPLIWLKSVWNVLMNSPVYNDYDVYDDQSTRAFLIANYMIEKKLFTLWLFDGHGRILVQIFDVLQYLINKNKLQISLNDFKFYVYDIDPAVHQWHTLFFPNNVTSILGDIFNYLTPLTIPQSTITSSSLSITSSLSIPNTTSSKTSEYKIPKRQPITNYYDDDDDVIVKSTCKINAKEEDKILLYLNFCGISASMENVQRLFDSDQYKHIFYSFSKRNVRPEYIEILTNGIEISHRDLFFTYKKKCK